MSKIFAVLVLVAAMASFGLMGMSSALGANSDCPTGTAFIATYDVNRSSITLESGADVVTFSDLMVKSDGELIRFDFSSTVDVNYVFVKAGSSPGDSGNYDYRPGSVRSDNDLATPTDKGVSHITFCGPVTLVVTPTPTPTPTPLVTPTPTPTPGPSTVAGVQTQPAGSAAALTPAQAVVGQQQVAATTTPGTISALPSTSTAPAGAPIGALGAVIVGMGTLLLRRRT